MVCLLAFMAHFYSPTIEMRTHFDKAIDLVDTLALIFLAPLLVHFAAIYPSRYSLFRERRLAALGCYGPAAMLMTIELLLRFAPLRALLIFPVVNLRSGLNRIELLFFSLSLIASGLLFIRTFRAARSIVVRQQLKWVMWGMSIAATTLRYSISLFSGCSVSRLCVDADGTRTADPRTGNAWILDRPLSTDGCRCRHAPVIRLYRRHTIGRRTLRFGYGDQLRGARVAHPPGSDAADRGGNDVDYCHALRAGQKLGSGANRPDVACVKNTTTG
jgi:hypothetical protein